MSQRTHTVLVAVSDPAFALRAGRALRAARYKLLVTRSVTTASRIAPHVDVVLIDSAVAEPHGVQAFVDEIRLIVASAGDDGEPDTPVIEVAGLEPEMLSADGMLLADASDTEIEATVAAHIALRDLRRKERAASDALWFEDRSN